MGRRLRVLVVCADFPYPPRSGFAMRVYQLARRLAGRHEVTLLSYASPADGDRVERLQRELAVEVVPRRPPSRGAKRARQLLSVASPRPFACRAVESPELQAAVDGLCARGRFDAIQLESSLLCGLRFPAGVPLVLDEHNVEYEVFRRMQEGEQGRLRRAFYRLEHARFRRFEQRCWRQVAGCAVPSAREEAIVRRHAPATPTAVVPNGVDLRDFRPAAQPPEPRTVVFNGLLRYRPNLDAARFLVEEVWPLVAQRCPEARLTIVGRGEDADVRRLERPGVTVTGEVPDVRPHLARAALVAVPVRMGGGTRLKVLEGLALAKPMVSTTLGCEGIEVRHGEHLLVADTAQRFADAVLRLFADPALGERLGRAGRALMEREYSWEACAERLAELYERALAGRAEPATLPAGRPAGVEA